MYDKNIFDKLERAIRKMRGHDTPGALTSEGWRDYQKEYKKNMPIVHWVFATISSIEVFIGRHIVNHWTNFWYSLRSRFIMPSAVVDIQSLDKWQYHDPCEVLLHANFQVLVDFVEYEVCVHERPTWYTWMRKIPILGYFIPIARDRVGGLKHLDWECELTYDENWVTKDDPRLGQLTSQALAAREKRELYLWWKDVRPNRPDPFDASGLNAYYDARPDSDVFDSSNTNRTAWRKLSDECNRIEREYDEEDECNLIRLIKIRQSMWT